MNSSVHMEKSSSSLKIDYVLRRYRRERNYHLMVLPGLIFLIIFCYLPMAGLSMAFQEYQLGKGVFGSPWVGFRQFQMLFRDPAFWVAFKNTVGISAFKMVFGFMTPIILALMLNEVSCIPYKRLVQTTSYLPHFISWVVVASILTFWCGTDFQGIINIVLVNLHIIKEPIPFLTYPNYFWTIALLSELWKSTGWWSIIYLAAISGIDQEIYEAATVDGAGRFNKIWSITLPSIKSTMMVILILSVGNLFRGSFDQSYLLQNSMNFTSSDILETYVLRMGLRLSRFSFSTAAGMFQSLLNVIVVFTVNMIVRTVDSEQGLF